MIQIFNFLSQKIGSFLHKKSLVIVGNAPLDTDFSKIIDSSNCVVRFNDCVNYNINSGTKTDILIMTNTGDPNTHQTLKTMLKNRTGAKVKEELPYLENVKQVWFVRPDIVFLYNFFKNNFTEDNHFIKQEFIKQEFISFQITGERNLVTEIINAQKISEEKVTVITENMYIRIWEKLLFYGTTDAIMPSTGMLGIEMILDDPAFNDYEKFIVGFGWEGWNGHPWQSEKLLVENYIKNGVLKILLCDEKRQS